MTEVAPRRLGFAPPAPSSLVAARALKAATLASAASNGLSESASASSTESSWQSYVQQQAHVQRVLLEQAPMLAPLHQRHLATLFGTNRAAGDASKGFPKVSPQEWQSLLEQFSSGVEEQLGQTVTASDEEVEEPETTG